MLSKEGRPIGSLGIGASIGDELIFRHGHSEAYTYTAEAQGLSFCLECATTHSSSGERLKVKEALINAGYE